MKQNAFKQYLILMRPLWREVLYSATAISGKRRTFLNKRQTAVPNEHSRGTVLLFILFTGVILGFYSALFSTGITKVLMTAGMENQYLRMISLLIPFLVLFIGFLQAITILYHESSLESLLVLPVRPSAVISAKMTQAFIPSAYAVFCIAFPGIVAHGILTNRSWLYYVQALFSVPLCMIGPYAIAMMLLLAVMRYTKFARNKDRFQMVSSITAIVLILGFSVLFQGGSRGYASGAGFLMKEGAESLFAGASRFVPTSGLAAAMLIRSGTWHTFLFGAALLAADTAALALMLALAGRLYITGVLGMVGSAAPKRRLTSAEYAKSLRPARPYRALVRKEWMLLFRTPAFFTQTILPLFLMPIFFVGVFLFGFLKSAPREFDWMRMIRLFLVSGAWKNELWVIALVVSGVAAFFSGTSMISSTAVSRQGAEFACTRTIPVPARTQMAAWLTPGLTCMLIIWALITGVLTVLFRPPLPLVLIVLFFAITNGALVQFSSFYVDLLRPSLEWENEIQGVKSTRSGMVSTLGMFAYIGVLVLLALAVNALSGGNALPITLTLALVALTASVLSGWFCFRRVDGLLRRIEI